MKRLLFLLIPILLTLTGCAAIQVKKAQERIESVCNSLMGKTEQEVIVALGAPQKFENISGLTVYHYYKSYGTCSNIYTNYTFGNVQSWEAFDKFDLVFKNGRAISWTSDVQR